MQESRQQVVVVPYTFIIDHATSYGQAVFLSGSAHCLGLWNTTDALRMECTDGRYWIKTVLIPVQHKIQYKYFESSFQYGQPNNKQSKVNWLGNRNEQVRIPQQHKNRFQEADKCELRVMSFNVRYENSNDKGQISWEARKHKCSRTILEELPDLVGVQEPKKAQVEYLFQQTRHLYTYFGKPRDLKASENSGIFVRKDKFIVKEETYTWINETKTPGKNGYGAHLPRYFTSLVLQPISQKWLIMMVNTHLDHQSGQARAQGVRMISQAIAEKQSKYGNLLNDIVVTGDFNSSDGDPIFDQLQVRNNKMISLRWQLPKEESDLGETFNGFKLKKNARWVTIDHIFVSLQKLNPLNFRVLRKELVSDHYPVLSLFRAENHKKQKQ